MKTECLRAKHMLGELTLGDLVSVRSIKSTISSIRIKKHELPVYGTKRIRHTNELILFNENTKSQTASRYASLPMDAKVKVIGKKVLVPIKNHAVAMFHAVTGQVTITLEKQPEFSKIEETTGQNP